MAHSQGVWRGVGENGAWVRKQNCCEWRQRKRGQPVIGCPLCVSGPSFLLKFA